MRLNSQAVWVGLFIGVVITGLGFFVFLQINKNVNESTEPTINTDQDPTQTILPFDPEKEGIIEGIIVSRNNQEIIVNDSEKTIFFSPQTIIEKIVINESETLEDITYDKEPAMIDELVTGVGIEVTCQNTSVNSCDAQNILIQSEIIDLETTISEIYPPVQE